MPTSGKYSSVAVTCLGIACWLVTTMPTAASVSTSYRNNFRACTARLLSVGIADAAAANACAAAFAPRDLSSCVLRIEQQTEIAAGDALATCRQVRRPDELSTCVVGITRTNEQLTPGVLDYCRRSILPVRFAECVVGLRSEINLTPTQAMDTCIDASDPIGSLSPTFIPEGSTPTIQPSPVPVTPVPPDAPSPAPTTPVTP